MARWFRRLMPIVPLALVVLAAIDAVTAFEGGRLGRGAFKAIGGLVWLFIAYMLYETNKRIPTDDQ